MDEWIEYIFEGAKTILEEELSDDANGSTMLNDIHAFCRARAHNIWGADRNEDCARVLLHYDIENWMHSPLNVPLSEHKFSVPEWYEFGFSDAKKEEMAAHIKRYGTTATGIGRILVRMGRDRIWREAFKTSI